MCLTVSVSTSAAGASVLTILRSASTALLSSARRLLSLTERLVCASARRSGVRPAGVASARRCFACSCDAESANAQLPLTPFWPGARSLSVVADSAIAHSRRACPVVVVRRSAPAPSSAALVGVAKLTAGALGGWAVAGAKTGATADPSSGSPLGASALGLVAIGLIGRFGVLSKRPPKSPHEALPCASAAEGAAAVATHVAAIVPLADGPGEGGAAAAFFGGCSRLYAADDVARAPLCCAGAPPRPPPKAVDSRVVA